ncbi:hypothetical protein XENTR_v10008083 [Xenopus tropicalis]|nr:hypothetical protein XENTR_v10008083 [Xenopus tropicalis]
MERLTVKSLVWDFLNFYHHLETSTRLLLQAPWIEKEAHITILLFKLQTKVLLPFLLGKPSDWMFWI